MRMYTKLGPAQERIWRESASENSTESPPGGKGGLLYLVGVLATGVALHMIQESFTGDLYRMANTAVGLVGYLAWGGWVAFF